MQELSEQCNCTEVDAQKLIQEFVQEADAYLSASDVEDETLRQIILRKTLQRAAYKGMGGR